MGEVGLLAQENRDELIEGEIFDLPPPQHRASGVMARLFRVFLNQLGDHAFGWSQGTFILDAISAPRPDFVLLKPRKDNYLRAGPSAADALLIVEVSENSLPHDLKVKVPLYARHGIPEVWIVDIDSLQIHFFHTPKAGHYAKTSSTSAPRRVSIQALPDQAVDLTGLFEYLEPAPTGRPRRSNGSCRNPPPPKRARHRRTG